jgi:transcription factor C subunit 7
MTTETNFYFTRHGERQDWVEPEWKETAVQKSNPPLSAYGFEQAHELGVYVATQTNTSVIYCSPYLRTMQTALQVAKQVNKEHNRVKIRLEAGFSEYYVDETKPWTEETFPHSFDTICQREEYIAQHKHFFDTSYTSIFQPKYFLEAGLETREQLRERLRKSLSTILNEHKEQDVLVVTHAASLIESVRAFKTIAKQEANSVEKEQVVVEWDMSPVRAGVCSLTHFTLKDENWEMVENGKASFLTKGEQNPWIFPDDAHLYNVDL